MNPINSKPCLTSIRAAGLGLALLCAPFTLGFAQTTAAEPMPSSDSTRASTDKPKHPHERFLAKAQENGRTEVQLSQLASDRATNPQVRSFAQKVVSDHQQISNELTGLMSSAELSHPVDTTGASSSPATTPGTGLAPTEPGTGMTSATTPNSDSHEGYAAGATATTSGQSATADTKKSGLRAKWAGMKDDRKYKKLADKSGADFDKAYVKMMVDDHKDAVNLFEKGAKDSDPLVQNFATKYLPELRDDLAQAEQLQKTVSD